MFHLPQTHTHSSIQRHDKIHCLSPMNNSHMRTCTWKHVNIHTHIHPCVCLRVHEWHRSVLTVAWKISQGRREISKKKKKTICFSILDWWARAHTRSESPWLIEATLYQTDSSRSVGKHRKGGEGYARKMKERKKAGMEGKQETMRRREVNAGKQTAGERERESLWHIVV